MIGLTSVTFRALDAQSIVKLAVQAGLDGLEWGGDVHVPPENEENARQVRALTERAGLKVLSYGSYYRLLKGQDFEPVLKAALALGAPNIRIWAGDISPEQATDEDYTAAGLELKRICALAAAQGITVSTEYHRNSLTQTAESAQRLLREADCSNLYTYWQPNPDITHEENVRELTLVHPWLSHIHAFQWGAGSVRQPMSAGKDLWQTYIRTAALPKERAYIMEFVIEDDPQQFLQDAAQLKSWLAE